MKTIARISVSVFSIILMVGAAYAWDDDHDLAELNTPVLQVNYGEQATCYASNVGAKDITIKMEIYRGNDGVLDYSTGPETLKPHQIFSVGVGVPTAYFWQCKIIVIKGNPKNVRGILYRVSGSPTAPSNPVEAR